MDAGHVSFGGRTGEDISAIEGPIHLEVAVNVSVGVGIGSSGHGEDAAGQEGNQNEWETFWMLISAGWIDL